MVIVLFLFAYLWLYLIFSIFTDLRFRSINEMVVISSIHVLLCFLLQKQTFLNVTRNFTSYFSIYVFHKSSFIIMNPKTDVFMRDL